jgi:hypothetical protein
MMARSRGLVGLFAVGLAVAVAIPANAQASAGSSQAIVTAVHHGDSITMPSGYSHYVYVGGSSANAVLSHSTFGGRPEGSESCIGKSGQDAVGITSSPTGSFQTDGSVAAIAGVGISGYSVQISKPVGANGYDADCYGSGTSGTASLSSGIGWNTPKHTTLYLVMIGTVGLSSLSETPYTGYPDCPTNAFKMLRDVTYGNPKSTTGLSPVASVAVGLATNPGGVACDFLFTGTELPLGNWYSIWVWSYKLTPLKD